MFWFFLHEIWDRWRDQKSHFNNDILQANIKQKTLGIPKIH